MRTGSHSQEQARAAQSRDVSGKHQQGPAPMWLQALEEAQSKNTTGKGRSGILILRLNLFISHLVLKTKSLKHNNFEAFISS